MKPINVNELENLCKEWEKELLNSEIQSLNINNGVYSFTFWKNRIYDLVIDFKLPSPIIVLTDSCNKKKDKAKKPIQLFFQSHFKGLKLKSILINRLYGRLLILEFFSSDLKTIEIVLFPQAKNIILKNIHLNKQVSLFKPKELKPLNSQIELHNFELRTNLEIYDQWKQVKERPTLKKNDISIERKEKQKEKIQKDLSQKENELIDTSKEFEELILNENYSIEYNKLNKKKIHLEKKIVVLKSILSDFDNFWSSHFQESKHFIKIKKENNKSEPKRRQLIVTPQITAYFGKSTEDNRKLIKQAKSWYIWMHLKDQPSSHCFIAFPKNVKISIEQIHSVAKWYIEETQGKKNNFSKFEIMFCPIKNISLIKGDKLARVSVKKYSTITISR